MTVISNSSIYNGLNSKKNKILVIYYNLYIYTPTLDHQTSSFYITRSLNVLSKVWTIHNWLGYDRFAASSLILIIQIVYVLNFKRYALVTIDA